MKNVLITLVMISFILSLTACGGGSTSPEPEIIPPPVTSEPDTFEISGNVIDGYVVGATLFMDLNFNGKFDDGEPSTETVEPTDDNPNYTLTVDGVHEDCGQYVPLVVHVPVGAIDLDDPDNPITEEYYMTIPPSFSIETDETMRNVTPLTSVLWNHIDRELRKTETELSCQSIIDNQHLRQDILQRLREQEIRVAQRYNTTVNSLYSDYVRSGNAGLHGIAKALVPGLAKAYEDTAALVEANPSAQVAFVEYYFKDNDAVRGQNWSRREYIQTTPGNWDEIGNRMTQGLNQIGELLYRRQQRTVAGTIESQTSISLVEGECIYSEYFTEVSGSTGYALVNIASAADTTWSGCLSIDRVANNSSQALSTKTFYSDGETVKDESIHYYGADNDWRYVELIGMSASSIGSGWLASNLGHIATDFFDDLDYNADSWTRLYNYYASEEFWNEDQVVSMHNSDDEYTVTTYHVDGTMSKLCGTWSQGDGSLTDCTE